MKLDEFRQLVYREFGSDLRHATPANMREFLNRLQQMKAGDRDGPFVLDEKKTTLESIMKDFFARALEMPQEEALILLWTVGIELALGMVEDHVGAQLTPLFQGVEE